MSKIKENINDKNQKSLTKRNNINDFYLKELKTTHSGWVCINYNSEYLRERLSKLKEESNILKQKINIIESQHIKDKNNLEKIILTLREDNNFLKKNYQIQKININRISKDKLNLINEIKELKNINNNLNRDKEILLGQINELNNVINNNISPKLKNNENDLLFLKNKINESEKIIISLKNEKMRLIDDNNNKSELIKVLTNQNKKLLNEIKMKYNKDLSFIESIEKIGITKNINEDVYQEIINKYNNDDNNNNNTYNAKNKIIMNYSFDNNDIFCDKENEINNKIKLFNIRKRNKKNSENKNDRKRLNRSEFQ